MTNMTKAAEAADRPAEQVIQKTVLTTSEAAAFLGMSRQRLRSLDIPRYVLSSRSQFYLIAELEEWVRQLPQYGEMPQDRMSLHTQVVCV